MFHDTLGSVLGEPDATGRFEVSKFDSGLVYVFFRDFFLGQQSTT